MLATGPRSSPLCHRVCSWPGSRAYSCSRPRPCPDPTPTHPTPSLPLFLLFAAETKWKPSDSSSSSSSDGGVDAVFTSLGGSRQCSGLPASQPAGWGIMSVRPASCKVKDTPDARRRRFLTRTLFNWRLLPEMIKQRHPCFEAILTSDYMLKSSSCHCFLLVA